MPHDRPLRRYGHPRGPWPLAMIALLAGLVLCVATSCRGADQAPLQLQPAREVVWKDFLGVNAHSLWFSPDVYRQQMDRWQALGLEWMRIDLHWDRLEPSQGQFRWDLLDPLMQEVARRHLQAEVYLVGSAPHATSAPPGVSNPDQYPPKDPALFARSMAQLATRYPQVRAWQVWNEPNLPSFWYPREDPAGYGRLLLATTEALRKAAPGRDVVLGGMAYFSQMPTRGNALMIEALGKGGLFQLGLVIAYHPYSLQPEGDDPRARDFILRAQQGNSALRAAGVRQIWADEWGWSSYAGPKEEQPIIGVQGQADYVLRRLALMSALDYDKAFLFALSDLDARATPRDRRYGLLDEQARPKPVYFALQRFLRITGPRLLPGVAPRLAAGAPAGLIGIAWQRPDGRRLWLFWSDRAGSVTLPDIPQATLHAPLTGQPAMTLRRGADGLRVPVDTQLHILEWP